MPIKDALRQYIKEDNILFCMPGHKQGKGFKKDLEYMDFVSADLTEVDGLDNLHRPEYAIKESQKLLSELYGSKKSYFLINGSTSGNLAMIFSAFNEEDKVIVQRDCHKSIFNGIILKKLRPIYIKSSIDYNFNAPLTMNMEHFFSLFNENKDAKGLIITYPNYYGVCEDLRTIIKECKSRGMKVLVDCAHGAHFGINEKLPPNPLKLGADMVVMSAHKTLPSFTQTAYLHVSDSMDINIVDFYVSSFSSTSPSYMFLMSMDYARYYLQEYGKEDYDKLIDNCIKCKKEIDKISFIKTLSKKNMVNSNGIELDPTRIVINLWENLNAHKLSRYLRERKIQVEMSDGSNIVLIPSTFNEEEDFEALLNALKDCDINYIEGNQLKFKEVEIPRKIYDPYRVLEKRKTYIKLEEAEGKICGDNIIPYPPGVPIIMMGELIDESIISMIKYYVKNDVTVIGIKDNKISVIDE